MSPKNHLKELWLIIRTKKLLRALFKCNHVLSLFHTLVSVGLMYLMIFSVLLLFLLFFDRSRVYYFCQLYNYVNVFVKTRCTYYINCSCILCCCQKILLPLKILLLKFFICCCCFCFYFCFC